MKDKVLLISCGGLGNGGVQAVLMSIVRGLSHKYQFDILLFTNQKRYYDEEFLSYGGKIIRVPFYEGKSKLRKKVDYYIRENRLYKEIVNQTRLNGPYIAIHCNNEYESAICLRASKKCSIPVRVTHAHVISNSSNFISRHINENYRKSINELSTHRIGCSKQAFDSLFGSSINSVVMNNPYNESKFITIMPYEKERMFHILQVGKFSSIKNQLFTIDVFNNIKKNNPDAILSFVGFGDDYKKEMLNKIAELGLNESISIYSSDTDIPNLLDNCSCFILPSISEGFGIVLVEAQAMGVQCFVSDSVPKSTNLGGCVYLSLDSGAEKWAERIVDEYQISHGKHTRYDCSSFYTARVLEFYDEIYRGIENENRYTNFS